MKKVLIFLMLAGFVNASIPVMVISKDRPVSMGACDNKDDCKYFPKKDILPYAIIYLCIVIITLCICGEVFKGIVNGDDYNKIVRK